MTETSSLVSLETLDDLALVTIDNPPVNATTHAVRTGLLDAVTRADEDAQVAAIIIRCAGRTFTSEGDIPEFGKPQHAPMLFEVCARIEACSKPVICAFHGTALGGGFEIGLASHVRIATTDTQLGLPEVRIGLVPGAGGTQRLPRLIGIVAAVDMASSGRFIAAREALKLGSIDAIADGDLLEHAIQAAQAMMGKPLRRSGEQHVDPVSTTEAGALLDTVRKKARGQEAPVIAAQLVLEAATLSTSEGIARERQEFMRLMDTQQGRALRHNFFAEREAAKIPGLESAKPHDLESIGVAGAGTMGSGIAAALLDAGYKVVSVEQDSKAAENGRARITSIFQRSVAAGRLSQEAMKAHMARLTSAHDLTAFATCDLVIEAVFDDLRIKQKLFAEVSRIVRRDCILATNTSYLNPDEIAQDTLHPERLAGLHFFAPANIMRLTEAVRAKHTSNETYATVLALARKLRKLPIYAGVCEGFIGNRMYSLYRRQCEFMLEEGALPHEIDAAMESWGLPMGPFRAFDLSGLDIAWALRKRQAATRDRTSRYSHISDRLCEAGHFGQKTGSGWYGYQDGKPVPNKFTRQVIEDASREKNLVRRSFSNDEIRLRLVAALANEGARILEEGIALRASDIDLVYINGYGWPAWLGGPMFQAQEFGWQRILHEVEMMYARDGSEFRPARQLFEAAVKGTLL
jgi:3-hydroxyacyl-CoA dehydrogenase